MYTRTLAVINTSYCGGRTYVLKTRPPVRPNTTRTRRSLLLIYTWPRCALPRRVTHFFCLFSRMFYRSISNDSQNCFARFASFHFNRNAEILQVYPRERMSAVFIVETPETTTLNYRSATIHRVVVEILELYTHTVF